MKKQLLVTFIGVLTLSLYNSVNAQITSFPYTEDFESFTLCANGCGASCLLTNNWSNASGDNLDWLTDSGGTSSSNTGPSVDHTLGNAAGNYLYVETSCSGTGYPSMQANLLSPSIDLTGTNNVQFEFWYHMYGQSMGTLHIDVSSDGGTTWTNDVVTAWTDNIDLWQQSPSISLAAWVGNVVVVRLRFISGNNFYSDVAVDDFHIYDILADDAGISAFSQPLLPTCTFNDSVSVELTNYGTNTLTSVTIDWEFNGTPQTTVNWTGSIPFGGSETVFLGLIPYVNGDNLSATTSLPNGMVEFASGASNDAASIDVSTGLNGNYTIGATGDYLTFNDAITALNAFGVCGPVVFNVEDGTYNEQIVLEEVIGMDATNTVTFQSLNADPSLVSLNFSPTGTTNNFVVSLDGGDYYTFNNLTLENTGTAYGRVISMQNGSNHNMWTNNIIAGTSSIGTSSLDMALLYSPSGSVDTSNVFDNNQFNYGSYSAYFYGESNNYETGNAFINNDFNNFYYRGLNIYYQDGIELGWNTFTPGPDYTGSLSRLYLVNMGPGLSIHNNDIRGMNNGYGIYLSNSTGSFGSELNIYNNFVHIGDTANASTSYGIYLTSSSFVHTLNNSVNIESIGTASRAFYCTGGTQNVLMNNILSNEGPGYAIYIASGLSESNYNNFYAPNGTPFFFGTGIADINTWQTNTGFDLMSDTLDPLFNSSEDLHTCQSQFIDAGAMPYAMITDDIDGQTRDTETPDIGADEFLGLANISFESDTIYKCSTDVLMLGGWEPQDDAISYLWNTTESLPAIGVTGSGTYSVYITTACGTTTPSIYVENIPDAVAEFTLFTSFLTAQCTNTSSGTINSYLWDFGDGQTSTEMNPTHLYSDTGDYVITLTVNGPCGSDVYTTNMNANTVGVEDLAIFSSLNVYPNPNEGNFTIDITADEASEVSFELTDAKGRVIWNHVAGNIQGNYSKAVQLDNQAVGLYFLKINSDEFSTVRKVMIK